VNIKLHILLLQKKWTDDRLYVQDRKKAFEKQNIDYQEINIEEYEPLKLKELLQSKDIIYIE
jgi:peptidase E